MLSDVTVRGIGKPGALWRDSGWAAVTAAFTLNGLLFGVWASRIPGFKEEFGLSQADLGVLLLGLAGGAIVTFPLAGGLSERLGAARLTIICATLLCPALVLLALAPTIPLLAVALFFFGSTQGAMDVAMNGWGAKTETRMNRSTMSIFHAMFSLGAGIGAASGYVAVRLGLPPVIHFTIMAILCGGTAFWFMWPERRSVVAQLTSASPRQKFFSLPSGPLLLVGLVAFVISVGEGGMADWSAVFMEKVTGVSQAQAALGYAVFSVAMVLTRLSGGMIILRLGPVRVVRFCGMIAMLGLIVVIFSRGLPASLAGFTLTGIGYAVVMPIVFSRAANDPVIPAGPAIASVAIVGYGGLLLGPPLIGFLAQLWGLKVSFGLIAVMALGAAIIAPALRVRSD